MSELAHVSDTFDAQRWIPVPGFEKLTDLTFHRGVVKAGSADASASSSSSEAQEKQKPYKPGRDRYELTDLAATEIADRGKIGKNFRFCGLRSIARRCAMLFVPIL